MYHYELVMQTVTAIICRECHCSKPLDEYHKHRTGTHGRTNICKPCAKIVYDEWCRTRQGFFVRAVFAAQASAKKRKNNGREEAGICTLEVQDLHDMWDRQQGRCYYSNVPMKAEPNTDWAASLERYILENVHLQPSYTSEGSTKCVQAQS